MLKLFKLSSLLILMVLPIHQAWSSAEKTNSRLLEIQIPSKPAQRIISLAPHITEMLYSAGAGHKIVGVVSSYSDFPKAALSLPVIGSYNAINLEEIIQLNPDLILAWQSGNRLQDIQRLEDLGFKVLQSDVTRLDDIPDEIERLGQLAGTQRHALAIANTLRQKLSEIRQLYQHVEPISSFYQIWNHPIITMNGRQFISQALNACGATNVYSDLKPLTAEVSLESVLERNPQVFLLGGQQAFQNGWLKSWQKYASLQAVKNKQLYLLNNNLFQRPTARLINALPELCQDIETARQHYQMLKLK
ncbi:MAG: cobalamin-binding protein [Spirochaetales bacterium]|jgi:ABC-type Fe3+-hydroxamate transport system substrate-binding protein|nr:cobalamin-binding protein [Spirochaetales bacterium]